MFKDVLLILLCGPFVCARCKTDSLRLASALFRLLSFGLKNWWVLVLTSRFLTNFFSAPKSLRYCHVSDQSKYMFFVTKKVISLLRRKMTPHTIFETTVDENLRIAFEFDLNHNYLFSSLTTAFCARTRPRKIQLLSTFWFRFKWPISGVKDFGFHWITVPWS